MTPQDFVQKIVQDRLNELQSAISCFVASQTPDKKLGRLAPRRGEPMVALGTYLRKVILPPPPAVCVCPPAPGIVWPMSMNDSIGDCTIAAVAHAIQRWNGTQLTDAQVLQMYENISGYNPSDPNTDSGCVITDVLNYWYDGKLPGDKLDGWAALNIKDLDEVKDSLNWFGVVDIGINCPQSALDNTDLWDYVPNSPIVGGHSVILVNYDTNFYAVSWGKLIPTTPAFLTAYMEEAYAMVSTDWVQSTGVSPSGLNLNQLVTDLHAIRAAR